jgi:hypothetical protein
MTMTAATRADLRRSSLRRYRHAIGIGDDEVPRHHLDAPAGYRNIACHACQLLGTGKGTERCADNTDTGL